MKGKRNFFNLTALILFFLFSSFLFASLARADVPPRYAAASLSAELALFTQEELAVTASRVEKPVSESPSATTVITREEIRRSGATHIPELLRYVAGIDVATVSPGHSEVNIRGMNKALSPRTLVLVDGRTVFVNAQGYTPWEAIPVAIEDIKRIEIVKGPVEALYGSPALNGVINIITRDPSEVKGVESNTSLGTQNTQRQTLLTGGTIGEKWAYKLAGEYSHIGTFQGLRRDAWQSGTGILIHSYLEKHAMFRQMFNGAVSYDFHENSKLLFSGGLNNSGFLFLSDPSTGMGPMSDFARFLKLDYSNLKPEEGRGFRWQAFWNSDTMIAITNYLNQEAHINTYDSSFQYNFPFGKRNNILWGGGVRYEQLDSNIFDPNFEVEKTLFGWNFFLQDEVKLLDHLTFFGTVRLDRHPKTDLNWAYRASLLYKPEKEHVFWLTQGRTFRNPTATESMVNLQYTMPGGAAPLDLLVGTISNGEVEPELMDSIELGYRGLIFERIKPEVSIFYNQLRDYICAQQGTPVLVLALPPYMYVPANEGNHGRVDIMGAEAGFTYLVTDWLKAFANYTYQHVNRKLDILLDDASPQDKANIGASFTLDRDEHKYMLDVFTTIVGPYSTPLTTGGAKNTQYYLTNMRAGYTYKDWADFSVYVYNLFKDVHRELQGGQDLGRRVIGKCSLKF